MHHISCKKNIIILLVTFDLMVISTTQRTLSDSDRRVLDGFTDIHGGHIDLHGTGLISINNQDHSSHSTSGVHVDLPGQHNNNAPVAVLHRTGTDVHVDHPGQHGNKSPVPIVHRDHSIGNSDSRTRWSPVSTASRHSGAHVDLPGEHGNQSPHAIIHRHGDTHVDLPGQHGNNSPISVLHRNEGSRTTTGAVDHTNGVGGLHTHHDDIHRPFPPFPGDFIDPITGAPVDIPNQGSFPHNPIVRPRAVDPAPPPPFGPVDGPHHHDHRDSIHPAPIGSPINPALLEPSTVGPFGFPPPQRPVLPRFVAPFPVGPEPFGPPPFLPPPGVRIRLGVGGRMNGLMRVPPLIGAFPPPRPRPLPPPRPIGIGLRGLVAGAIGSLLGSLLRP